MADGRRVAYSCEYMICMLRTLEARANAAALLAAHNAALAAEVRSLHEEIAELRAIVGLLVACERQRTEDDLDSYRRQLESALARLARRDPSIPLH